MGGQGPRAPGCGLGSGRQFRPPCRLHPAGHCPCPAFLCSGVKRGNRASTRRGGRIQGVPRVLWLSAVSLCAGQPLPGVYVGGRRASCVLLTQGTAAPCQDGGPSAPSPRALFHFSLTAGHGAPEAMSSSCCSCDLGSLFPGDLLQHTPHPRAEQPACFLLPIPQEKGAPEPDR